MTNTDYKRYARTYLQDQPRVDLVVQLRVALQKVVHDAETARDGASAPTGAHSFWFMAAAAAAAVVAAAAAAAVVAAAAAAAVVAAASAAAAVVAAAAAAVVAAAAAAEVAAAAAAVVAAAAAAAVATERERQEVVSNQNTLRINKYAGGRPYWAPTRAMMRQGYAVLITFFLSKSLS